MFDLAIIVPTKNEADNIEPLLKRLVPAMRDLNYKIIFVDDSSDSTPEVIKKHLSEIILMIHRVPSERNGLGNAVVRGFKEAADSKYLSAINADLQHPPEVLRRLYDAIIKTGSDIVVPSRYIGEGSSEGLETWDRKFFSWFLRYSVRMLFYSKLKNITDPGSGMYVFKREVIDGVDLKPIGYKILLEVLIKGSWSKSYEIPYTFVKRSFGVSKLTFARGLDFFKHLVKLFFYFYLKRPKRKTV